jgi:hypothetical protein
LRLDHTHEQIERSLKRFAPRDGLENAILPLEQLGALVCVPLCVFALAKSHKPVADALTEISDWISLQTDGLTLRANSGRVIPRARAFWLHVRPSVVRRFS